jgi:crossover junction endodeoxyribonuclease RuvC
MIITALDPGYDRCGVAVIERNDKGEETLLDSRCISTNRDDSFEQRILYISEELETIVKKYKPDVCVLETLFFSTNQKTAMRVAEVRGALILTASNASVPIKEFTPKQVKIAVTGDGGASKNQVMQMLPRLISIDKEIQYDDEYDAIAVGLTASATLRGVLGE